MCVGKWASLWRILPLKIVRVTLKLWRQPRKVRRRGYHPLIIRLLIDKKGSPKLHLRQAHSESNNEASDR